MEALKNTWKLSRLLGKVKFKKYPDDMLRRTFAVKRSIEKKRKKHSKKNTLDLPFLMFHGKKLHTESHHVRQTKAY